MAGKGTRIGGTRKEDDESHGALVNELEQWRQLDDIKG